MRRELYSQCFDETIRQTTIICLERGLLLLRVRDEFRMTLHACMVRSEKRVITITHQYFRHFLSKAQIMALRTPGSKNQTRTTSPPGSPRSRLSWPRWPLRPPDWGMRSGRGSEQWRGRPAPGRGWPGSGQRPSTRQTSSSKGRLKRFYQTKRIRSRISQLYKYRFWMTFIVQLLLLNRV